MLLYGYSRGVRSARKIEGACEEDVAFKTIAMLETPDHATIARFVERHEQALGELFGQLLGLCAQAGLVRPGVVAIDGTRMAGNASRESTLDFGAIAREILADARAIDEAEDELYGRRAGMSCPSSCALGRDARSSFAEPASSAIGSARRPKRMKANLGYAQGYNAQAVVDEGQIVVAAEIINNPADFSQLDPMITTAIGELERAGVADRPQVALADAQYWNEQQFDEVIANKHIQVLIPPDSGGATSPRRGWIGGRYSWMRAVLDSARGKELYCRRIQMIEPVFAHTKHNRLITRFHRRGPVAVRTEWRLLMATHNLTKLHRHHIAALGA